MARIPTTEWAQFIETVIGQPHDAFLRESAITLRYIFDLGDEALASLDTLARLALDTGTTVSEEPSPGIQ